MVSVVLLACAVLCISIPTFIFLMCIMIDRGDVDDLVIVLPLLSCSAGATVLAILSLCMA